MFIRSGRAAGCASPAPEATGSRAPVLAALPNFHPSSLTPVLRNEDKPVISSQEAGWVSRHHQLLGAWSFGQGVYDETMMRTTSLPTWDGPADGVSG